MNQSRYKQNTSQGQGHVTVTGGISVLGCLMPTIYSTGEGVMPALVMGMAEHTTPYTGQMRSTRVYVSYTHSPGLEDAHAMHATPKHPRVALRNRVNQGL